MCEGSIRVVLNIKAVHGVHAGTVKYKPPAMRAAAAAAAAATGNAAGADEVDERIVRRARGLLNRMGEGNLHQIASDMVELADQEGRKIVLDAVTSELLQVSCWALTLHKWRCGHVSKSLGPPHSVTTSKQAKYLVSLDCCE